MRASYLVGQTVFGLDRLDGYRAMQWTAGVAMALAVVAGMAWTYRVTRSEGAEIVFAALVIPSPMIGIYAFAVMTEGTTLLLVATAFWGWERALARPRHANWWAVAAGAAFGIAIDIREPAALLCTWPVFSCFTDRPPRRWMLLGLAVAAALLVALAVGVLGGWLWFPSGAWPSHSWGAGAMAIHFQWPDRSYFKHMVQWTNEMTWEARKYRLSVGENLLYLLKYGMAAMPVAFPLTILALAGGAWAVWGGGCCGWRRLRRRSWPR